jgi:xylan 1,4-beta-xylosidase
MLAEGGTGWNHGISMARARAITGPYELDPQTSVLTARDDYTQPLQKAGHGELVETPAGEWYLVHLASRPISPERRCVLGRETCFQRVVWSSDGWLRLAHGGHHPALTWPAPAGLKEAPWPTPLARDDFDAVVLDASWSSLRVPMDDSWLSLRERRGWLRLRGRDSQHSLFEQSLVAKRLQHFQATAETQLEFAPTHFTQSAGLTLWYNTRAHYLLRVTHDETLGVIVGIVFTDSGNYDELPAGQLVINDWKQIHLRAEIDFGRLQFAASPDGKDWQHVGPILDASKISDDYAAGFTGAMIGLFAHDLGGSRTHADFDFFSLHAPP